MATVTKENIGGLHDKLILKLEKADYLPAFEKALKDYSKKANIPGFRKGMVPSGLIKKMYGSSLFTDEVLRTVDRELINYLETDKLNIFAQPLPLEMDVRQLDVNNPTDYTFHFEIGMKPEFALPELDKIKTTRYVVKVTDEMIDSEVTRLQNRYGNMKDIDTVSSDDDVLNVVFSEIDENGNEIEGGIKKDNSLLLKYFKEATRIDFMGKTINDFTTAQLSKAFDDKELEWILNDLGFDKNDAAAPLKHFKIQITKIGLLEKKELNEEFFNQLYPGKEIKTADDFRAKIKEQIQAHWDAQASSQLQHQVYHELLDHTTIHFPENFLKKWMKTQQNSSDPNSLPKTEEEVEKEFPTFLNQLKWTLISDKIVQENAIQVQPDEIRIFAKQQLFSYMGSGNINEDQPWINEYIEKMMKDRKYVEESYTRIQTQKIFEWGENKVNPELKDINAEDFTKMIESHQHEHH